MFEELPGQEEIMLGPYTTQAVDMLDFWERQIEWSYVTFGPPEFRGPTGSLKHLEKEAKEAYEEKDRIKQKEEIADCLFLTFDAAHRAGMSFRELVDTCMAKLRKNKAREWKDWRTIDPNEPSEHNNL